MGMKYFTWNFNFEIFQTWNFYLSWNIEKYIILILCFLECFVESSLMVRLISYLITD